MITIMHGPLSRLFEDASRTALDPGEILFRLGEEITTMYRVRTGEVRLIRHTSQGASLILHRASAGSILAEASAYSMRYHCDSEASGSVMLDALPKIRFLEGLSTDPDIATEWAALLARGVQAARLRAEIRSLPRVTDRLDAWFDAGNALPEKGKWQDVAAELSVTREALYRELSRRRLQVVDAQKNFSGLRDARRDICSE